MKTYLKDKTDDLLLIEVKCLVAQERKILTEILHYLQEIDTRKLHLERGYPSLFEFVVHELAYSAAAAQRRIEAMRLLRAVPEIETQIKNGEISLSVAAQAQSFFKQEEIRRQKTNQGILPKENKLVILGTLLGQSSRECEKILTRLSPESALKQKERTQALPGENTLIQFVADEALMEKLNRLKNLLSHKNPEGRFDKLFQEVADIALKRLEPREPKAPSISVPDAEKPFPTSEIPRPPSSRYIPASIRKFVLKRDSSCTFRDHRTGRFCGSRFGLQFDHILPYALGGDHSPENLTLRCRAHNRFRAERMGLTRNEAKIDPNFQARGS